MSQSQPATLGKYQIIREIARSNDIVYEAFDPVMNRRVAVKELAIPPGSTDAQRQDRLKRFMREARAAGSLTHPNIVTVFEVAEDQGRTYIAMEYLDGKNLRQEMDKQGLIGQERAVEIASCVLKGLGFAHSKGVIHRDIKPDNIQLLENGTVKITDFGIARLTFEPNITMDGQVFGTPSYMSPEQINGKDLDVRSDLFSVGVILYEMLSGQKPFTGDTVVAIAYAIMNREPQAPASVPYPLWEVIETSLNKLPQFRYANAEAMLAGMEKAAAMVGASSSQPPAIFGVGAPGSSSASPSPYLQSSPYGPGPHQGGSLYQPSPQGQPNPSAYGAPYGGPYAPPAPGQVLNAPYLPGGAAPPQSQSYGPYAASYGPPPVVGPGGGQVLSQPYNPYGNPYLPSGVTLPGSANVPQYYPPPPRRPLVSPEARSFLLRLLIISVLAITFLVLTIMAVMAISKMAADSAAGRAASARRSAAGSQASPSQAGGQDGGTAGAAGGASQPGLEGGSQASPAVAPERSFESGVSFARSAAGEKIEDRRASLWRSSQLAFLAAANSDPVRSRVWIEQAVKVYFDLSDSLVQSGQTRLARQALQTAEGVAIGQPDIVQEVRTRQEQLGV